MSLEECGLGNPFQAEFLPSAIESQPGPTVPYRILYQASLGPNQGLYRIFTRSLPGLCRILPNPYRPQLHLYWASAGSAVGFYRASNLIEMPIEPC